MGKKVKCIDANGAGGTLDEGHIYEVNVEYNNVYLLVGVLSMWLKQRFEVVEDTTITPPVAETPADPPATIRNSTPKELPFDFDAYYGLSPKK